MVINLSEQNSLVGQWLSEIRDADAQTDRMRFRRNLERIGEIAGYEISKTMAYETRDIVTPMGVASCNILARQPVIATILRAGLPLFQGLLNYFDKADSAFVSAFRQHGSDDSFEIIQQYLSCPPLEGRFLILADPMLATGASLVKAIHRLREEGEPAAIHVVAVIASSVGIELATSQVEDLTIWTAAIDEELTAKGFIVPGLGDAGDLAFGLKKQQ